MPELQVVDDRHDPVEQDSIELQPLEPRIGGATQPVPIPPRSTLERCIRGLLRRDPLRMAAMALAGGELPYERDVEAIVDMLCNDSKLNWRRRLVALWALGHVPLSEWQRNEVISTAVLALQKRKWSTNFMSTTCAVGCLGNSLLAAPAIAYMLACDGRVNAVRAQAAELLARLNVLPAVGDLAQAVFDRNRPGCADVRAAGNGALRTLLPKLGEEHYGALPANVEPQLCRLLAPGDHGLEGLAIAALGEIGGSRSLTAMRGCESRTFGLALHDAAEKALRRIEARAQRERDAGRLLRPAAPPNTPAEVLLRPAAGGPSQGSELLVRPVAASADGEPAVAELRRGSGESS